MFLILVSCYLLYFSYPKLIANIVLETVGRTLSAGTLIYSGASNVVKSTYARFSYFQNLEAENLRLKLEVESLLKVKASQASLRTENIILKEMLNVPKELDKTFVTAKVVSTSVSPFASSLIIRSGEKEGVKVNDIVRGAKGLIGRITEVSRHYSTVMLVNDHNSRIPVVAGDSRVRGILAKQADSLKMIYLNEDHNIQVGETIYTSGDGKIFAKGVPVATVLKVTDKEVFVETVENFSDFDFVIVESAFD
ncbi:MAG: hypothetical protein Tsb006_0370 [Rickettsiaceae bacterium]